MRGSSLVLGLVLIAGGCRGQTSSGSGVGSSGDALVVEPACQESSDAAVGLLEPGGGSRCGLALELAGEQLSLVQLADAQVAGRGTAPRACGEGLARCEVEGRIDERLGPLVLLSVRGHESEMPTQVYLGWLAGERLVFVDTWYGLPSVIDHTRVGPSWALAPYDCGGQGLELHPQARLPTTYLEPDETLRALSGVWTVSEDGSPQPPKPAPEQALAGANCRPAFEHLP